MPEPTIALSPRQVTSNRVSERRIAMRGSVAVSAGPHRLCEPRARALLLRARNRAPRIGGEIAQVHGGELTQPGLLGAPHRVRDPAWGLVARSGEPARPVPADLLAAEARARPLDRHDHVAQRD